MNDEAFARRFYADRAELESLGIHLKVDKPAEGYYEAENYSLHPRTSTCPRSSSRTRSWARCACRCRCSTASSPTPSRCGSPCNSSPGASRARSTRPSSGPSRWRSRPAGAGVSLAAALEGGDGDLPPQDDPVRLLHDRPRRRGEAQGGPLPPALSRRPVLPDRVRTRARRRARVPGLANPREGRLLLQGRTRLQPPRGVRPALVRDSHRLAARRPRRPRPHPAPRADRLACAASLRPRRRSDRGRGRRGRVRDRLRRLARCSPGCSASATGPDRGPAGEP